MKERENIENRRAEEKKVAAGKRLDAKLTWLSVVRGQDFNGLSKLSKYFANAPYLANLLNGVKSYLRGGGLNDPNVMTVAKIIEQCHKGEIDFDQVNKHLKILGCSILDGIEVQYNIDIIRIDTYYQELAEVEAVGEDSGCFSFCTIS